MSSGSVRLAITFLVCRDADSSSANGTIQPFVGNSLGDSISEEMRSCSFKIQALPHQQIIFSCSHINLSEGYLTVSRFDHVHTFILTFI